MRRPQPLPKRETQPSHTTVWHARSVGYTRSAVDVWGGNAPYLVSVPTEEDSAACLGHGVGMSQYGALAMAQRGLTAEDILMHYYTGCELSRLG